MYLYVYERDSRTGHIEIHARYMQDTWDTYRLGKPVNPPKRKPPVTPGMVSIMEPTLERGSHYCVVKLTARRLVSTGHAEPTRQLELLWG